MRRGEEEDDEGERRQGCHGRGFVHAYYGAMVAHNGSSNSLTRALPPGLQARKHLHNL